MASALYQATIEHKSGPVIRIRVTIDHRDVSEFGTDQGFAWSLMTRWVSPPDNEDDRALAARYIRRVELSPVEGGAVVRCEPSFLAVSRDDPERGPSVVYTIEVSDPALLEGAPVGATEGIHDYLDPIEAGMKKPVKKATAKRKPVKSAPSPRTFEDLRRFALRPDKRSDSLFLHSVRLLRHWAADTADAEVMPWLDRFTDAPSGRRSHAAGMLAVDRVRSGQLGSARSWLEVAESAFPDDAEHSLEERRDVAYEALIPAWWLLGRDQHAREAFDAQRRKREARLPGGGAANTMAPNQAYHFLFSLAALGRQTDLVEELFSHVLAGSDYRADLLVPGVLALLADGREKLFERVLTKWSGLGSSYDKGLSIEVLRLLVRAGAPERYIGLTVKHTLLERPLAEAALAACERRDPASAVAAAIEVLEAGKLFRYSELALAILAAHAPEHAGASADRIPAMGDPVAADRFKYLAALGRHDEARAGLCADNARAIALVTTDRALAIDALKMAVERTQSAADLRYPPDFAHLAYLGERACVEASLERKLEQLRELPPKERSWPARMLASTAGMVGRADLGQKAVLLASKSARAEAAEALAGGCAGAGDWTGAFAGLELFPAEESYDQHRAALMVLLAMGDAPFDGWQAVPLRTR